MAKRFEPLEGPSQRQLRVGELIRRTIAQVLTRGDIYVPELAHISITVGEVRITPDLKLAHVYVLPLGGQDGDAVVDALNGIKGELRHALNKAVTLKFSPRLKFVLDQSFEQFDETRRLLNQTQVKRDLGT